MNNLAGLNNRKLKIGIEAQRLFRKRKHGIEIVALEMIRELQKIDKTNEYFVFVNPDEDKSCLTETDNFRIVELPSGNFAMWEQFKLPKAVTKYGLDLLHCTGNTAPVFRTTKTLLTIHDIFFTSFSNIKGTPYQVLGNFYRKLIFPRLAHFDHLITVSETEKKNIVEKLSLDPASIDVIYNGVNPKFRPVTDVLKLQEIRTKYNLPEKFVFFFANTAPKKNTIRVLQAFHQFVKNNPDAKLVVADSTGIYIRSCLEKLGLTSMEANLLLLGFVGNDDLPAIYSLTHLFLFPSIEESFGLPIIEAQASGAPVITSNLSAIPEIAGDSAVLVDPYSIDDITGALTALWHNETVRQQLIEKGKRNALRFSWEKTALQVHDLYMRMTNDLG